MTRVRELSDDDVRLLKGILADAASWQQSDAERLLLRRLVADDPAPVETRRASLNAIRGRYSEDKTLHLGDLDILLELAVNDYDLSASDIASNLHELLTGENVEHFLPASERAPAPPRPPRPPPLGPMTRIDAYECEDDRLRVEVERVPGTDDVQSGHLSAHARDELPGVVPHCPTCEREMTFAGSKLRRAR